MGKVVIVIVILEIVAVVLACRAIRLASIAQALAAEAIEDVRCLEKIVLRANALAVQLAEHADKMNKVGLSQGWNNDETVPS